jgi:hypothetical protein
MQRPRVLTGLERRRTRPLAPAGDC